jgi:hypothetical protein
MNHNSKLESLPAHSSPLKALGNLTSLVNLLVQSSDQKLLVPITWKLNKRIVVKSHFYMLRKQLVE